MAVKEQRIFLPDKILQPAKTVDGIESFVALAKIFGGCKKKLFALGMASRLQIFLGEQAQCSNVYPLIFLAVYQGIPVKG